MKNYLVRRHFTGGRTGLIYSATIAHYRRQRILRMLAAKGSRQTSGSDMDAPESDSRHVKQEAHSASPQKTMDAT
jgi:hypothetical protein